VLFIVIKASSVPGERHADKPWAWPNGFIGGLGAAGSHETEIGTDRQLEKVRAQKSRREEQHLQILDLAAVGVQPRDDLVREFLGLLLLVM
jgi:hypothetical protein